MCWLESLVELVWKSRSLGLRSGLYNVKSSARRVCEQLGRELVQLLGLSCAINWANRSKQLKLKVNLTGLDL